MAELGFDYNAMDHEPQGTFDPVPAGEYVAMITESERTKTRAGDGELLKLVWTITDGEFAGRLVFDRVNLVNPSQQAVEIGMRQLSSICRATGKLNIHDSAELHNLPCRIKVRVRPPGPDKNGVHREASNDIKAYEPLDAPAAASSPVGSVTKPVFRPAATPARSPSQAAPATPAKRPWERAK